MRYLYHATSYDNLGNILDEGLKLSSDRVVYLAETPKDAVKFVVLRGYDRILTVKVKVPKKLENTIIGTFDHSFSIFKCRAFGSTINIETNRLTDYAVWDIGNMF